MPKKLLQTISQWATWGRAQCKNMIPVSPLSLVCSLISKPSLCQQPLGQPNTENMERKNIQASQKIILSPIPFTPMCKVHKSFIYLSSLVLSIEQFYLFICLIIYLFLSFQIILRGAFHHMTPPQWHMIVTWRRVGLNHSWHNTPGCLKKGELRRAVQGPYTTWGLSPQGCHPLVQIWEHVGSVEFVRMWVTGEEWLRTTSLVLWRRSNEPPSFLYFTPC